VHDLWVTYRIASNVMSLTYHKQHKTNCDAIMVFHCETNSLSQLFSVDLTTKGFGTEQIQQELSALSPDNKIGRMDQDTTRGKFDLKNH
jgi:primosomal protein N' (replication factor Y)